MKLMLRDLSNLLLMWQKSEGRGQKSLRTTNNQLITNLFVKELLSISHNIVGSLSNSLSLEAALH
jgi:hypothetical protein